MYALQQHLRWDVCLLPIPKGWARICKKWRTLSNHKDSKTGEMHYKETMNSRSWNDSNNRILYPTTGVEKFVVASFNWRWATRRCARPTRGECPASTTLTVTVQDIWTWSHDFMQSLVSNLHKLNFRFWWKMVLQHRARGAKSTATLFCCRERAPGVSPADQPARTLRGVGVGRRQLEGGSARGTLRHGQGTRQ